MVNSVVDVKLIKDTSINEDKWFKTPFKKELFVEFTILNIVKYCETILFPYSVEEFGELRVYGIVIQTDHLISFVSM